MDQNNPAVMALAAVPPSVLEAVESDPSVLARYGKRYTMIAMSYMHQRMRDPNIPIGQRLQWMEFAAKIGEVGAYSKATALPQSQGEKFVLNINMGPSSKPETISVQATEIKDISNAG